jgi:hypothetical protein
MLMPNIVLEPAEIVALGNAFDRACEDLGIKNSSLDVSKRECLLQTMISLMRKGEMDGEVLRRRAVLHFTNTPQPTV